MFPAQILSIVDILITIQLKPKIRKNWLVYMMKKNVWSSSRNLELETGRLIFEEDKDRMFPWLSMQHWFFSALKPLAFADMCSLLQKHDTV